jgi:hypothetical protein
MSQILHIFRKDVRHFWIEIAGSLAILALYVWHTVHEWGRPSAEPAFELFSGSWNLVMILVPVLWCLLIIRSMQDESLVGNRQFWTTRPYEWRKLAAEKLLLVVTFIHLPLLVTHIFLLHHAGFSVAHCVLGLLQMHLLLFLFLGLTTAVVASVTSSIVQVLVWIVGIVFYIAGWTALFAYLPRGYMPTASDTADYASPIAAGACMVALILFQYWRRTTWIARFTIIGAVLLLTALISAVPFVVDPSSGFSPLGTEEQFPLTIQMLNQDPQPTDLRARGPNHAKQVPVWFPMKATETGDGTMSVMRGALVTIEAPDGSRWTSHWRAYFYQYWPGEASYPLLVQVDRKFFEQFRDTPVKVHFSFAIAGYHETKIHQFRAEEGVFPVPGVGECWVDTAFEPGGGANWIKCMAPVNHSAFMGWYDSSASTCHLQAGPQKDVDPDLHETLHLFTQEDSWTPRIIPVDFFALHFSPPLRGSRTRPALGICAGTPFTLATPVAFRHLRLEAEVDGVKLSDYGPVGGSPKSN